MNMRLFLSVSVLVFVVSMMHAAVDESLGLELLTQKMYKIVNLVNTAKNSFSEAEEMEMTETILLFKVRNIQDGVSAAQISDEQLDLLIADEFGQIEADMAPVIELQRGITMCKQVVARVANATRSGSLPELSAELLAQVQQEDVDYKAARLNFIEKLEAYINA